LHRGPGEINYPICCGGVVFNPGDLVVADASGIVVVPQEIAAGLLERLRAHKQANADYFEAVRRGDFSNAWVDRNLEEQQCPVVRGEVGTAPSPAVIPASVPAPTTVLTATADASAVVPDASLPVP
jgi:hypothetical protein